MIAAMMPMGTLIKKHQCQLSVSVQVAAQRRSDRGRDDQAHEEERLHDSVLFGRKDLNETRLGGRE